VACGAKRGTAIKPEWVGADAFKEGVMARQRKVYVIEFKPCNGRKWREADCAISFTEAKQMLQRIQNVNPDDVWRLKEYYPRD